MRSLDTNILVRVIVQDDEAQAAAAASILLEPCLIPLTVLAETEWVLRSVYAFRRETITSMLTTLLDGPTITVEEPDLVRWGIERFARGADFADMLHLIGSRSAAQFITFDQNVAKQAGTGCPVPVQVLH